MNHHRTVISTGASWLYRDAEWRDLQVARAGDSAGASKLQVLTQSAPQTSASRSATCRSWRKARHKHLHRALQPAGLSATAAKKSRLRSRWLGMGWTKKTTLCS